MFAFVRVVCVCNCCCYFGWCTVAAVDSWLYIFVFDITYWSIAALSQSGVECVQYAHSVGIHSSSHCFVVFDRRWYRIELIIVTWRIHVSAAWNWCKQSTCTCWLHWRVRVLRQCLHNSCLYNSCLFMDRDVLPKQELKLRIKLAERRLTRQELDVKQKVLGLAAEKLGKIQPLANRQVLNGVCHRLALIRLIKNNPWAILIMNHSKPNQRHQSRKCHLRISVPQPQFSLKKMRIKLYSLLIFCVPCKRRFHLWNLYECSDWSSKHFLWSLVLPEMHTRSAQIESIERLCNTLPFGQEGYHMWELGVHQSCNQATYIFIGYEVSKIQRDLQEASVPEDVFRFRWWVPESIPIRNLASHLSTCQYALVSCKRCQQTFARLSAKSHESSCCKNLITPTINSFHLKRHWTHRFKKEYSFYELWTIY